MAEKPAHGGLRGVETPCLSTVRCFCAGSIALCWCVCVGTRDAREPPSASVGERGVWMWRGDLGLGQLRAGISQVIPGLPMILVAFYNCVSDARPPAASLLLPLALINICRSASGLIQTWEERKRGGGARVRMTLRLHSASQTPRSAL